jgi:hypothetical protein
MFLLRTVGFPFIVTSQPSFYAAMSFAGATYYSIKNLPPNTANLLSLRHKAITSINNRLLEPNICTDDQTIAAVYVNTGICDATPLPTTSICLDLKRWFGCEEVWNPWDSGDYLLEWLFGSISTTPNFMVRLCTLERAPKWARGLPLSSTSSYQVVELL